MTEDRDLTLGEELSLLRVRLSNLANTICNLKYWSQRPDNSFKLSLPDNIYYALRKHMWELGTFEELVYLLVSFYDPEEAVLFREKQAQEAQRQLDRLREIIEEGRSQGEL